MGFEIVALGEIIKIFENNKTSLDELKEVLFSFKCKKNKDEEEFLHYKAIDYEQHNKARTYLLIDENESIVAYFSLAFKSISLEGISKTKMKQIVGGIKEDKTYSAFLIGHIAKNDNILEEIGDYIISVAENLLFEAQRIVGGRLIYLDCKDVPKLRSFYERNNYKYFNTSETSNLLQYYKKI
ncbi:MAG: acetyltransferase [Christensenellales bacterium]